MSVRSVTKDPEALTLTLIGDFAAPPARVWRVWSEPRLLEKWWGPPTYPATFATYEFEPGGSAAYYMTGPEGDRHHGGWDFTAIEAPRSLSFDDFFADETGTPNRNLPGTTAVVTLEASSDGTVMTITSHFGSLEQLEQLAAMGMIEGLTAAVSQIDALL
ncbi:MAG: SRPBCC domain-containing protein [Myxococcota bacterium]